jgi:SpoVK/Ycf46/Vps4 family AAA+-type ATPase
MANLPAVLLGGRLILWHGVPGTGKTSALRTLARENAKDILLEYVLDPDTFFGNETGYFVSVLFNDDDEIEAGKTRLLVLEDCDELLAADAKRQGGQGLARLLNLVDGLIGQGLRIGVLITTNDPLSSFHPAVSRPGRCGAAIGFDAFDQEEADQWFAGEGLGAQGRAKTSLAELLAIRDGRSVPEPRAPIGFVASAGRERRDS